jgi:hypothetical protein
MTFSFPHPIVLEREREGGGVTLANPCLAVSLSSAQHAACDLQKSVAFSRAVAKTASRERSRLLSLLRSRFKQAQFSLK